MLMANTDGPWIRFFASDWLAGTRGMTAAETGVYITLIALMYERDDGQIERDDKRLARMCGLKQHTFAAMLADLIEAGKITVSGSKLGNDRATYESQNRADRATKARNAALAKAERIQGENSASAPPKQSVSSAPKVLRARASEPEPDSKDEESLEASQRKRATRLPPDWAPSERDAQWLRDKWPGVTRSIVDTELEKFRNYWIAKSGQGATKRDWSATWKNWMITAQERTGTARQIRQPVETVSQAARALREELENAERQGDARSDRTIDGRLSSPGERRRPAAIEHIPDGD